MKDAVDDGMTPENLSLLERSFTCKENTPALRCSTGGKLEEASKSKRCYRNIENDSDVDTGWAWVVMAACFGGHTICSGLLFTTGLVHIALAKKFQAEESTTTWASAIFIAMTSFAGTYSPGLDVI